MSMTPKRPRALETIIDRLVAGRSTSIVAEDGASLQLWALGRARPALGGAVDRRDLKPLPSKPSTSSRPMPPAAPVTIATCCCSLIVSSYRFV
jgi:hypothetical protein